MTWGVINKRELKLIIKLTQAHKDLHDILDLAQDKRVHHHRVQFSVSCIDVFDVKHSTPLHRLQVYTLVNLVAIPQLF